MRLRSEAKLVAGVLALAGMLALSSPGIRVARAGDGDATRSDLFLSGVASEEPGGVCKVGDEPVATGDRSAAAKIAERIRMEMQNGDDKPIVLNGRGYNYKIPRDPQRELELLQAEARRQPEPANATR